MPRKKGKEIILIVLTILFLDQLSKFLIRQFISLNQSVPVIKKVFCLTLVHNRGAAFGIFKGQIALFIFTAVFAAILINLALKKRKEKKISLYSFSLCLILGGGLGNLIDRLVFGYVIDFLDLRIWPVFNLADTAISIGAVLLGWSILKSKKAKLQFKIKKF